MRALVSTRSGCNQLIYLGKTWGNLRVWTGYALWAYLTPETASHLVLQDPPFLPISDWNEGDQLWILDFVAMPGHHRRLARALRHRLRPHFKQAHRLVRDKTGAMLRTKAYTLRKDG
nr:toxin-activating lysine-acyltransferase [Xanthomonas populi]